MQKNIWQIFGHMMTKCFRELGMEEESSLTWKEHLQNA
jgi:hypothetical protein